MAKKRKAAQPAKKTTVAKTNPPPKRSAKRSGPPIKLDSPRTRNRFFKALQRYGSRGKAATLAGIDYKTLLNYEARNPEFAEQAREINELALDDLEAQVHDQALGDGMLAIRVLERRRPQKWCKRQEITHNGQIGVKAQIDFTVMRKELLDDPNYLEYLRDRAIESDRDAGVVCAIGEPREVEDGSAPRDGLDADCHPIVDPMGLFSTPEYQASGAMFWPDNVTAVFHYPRLGPFGLSVPQGQAPGFETGQIVLDKRRNWKTLKLAEWFCATGHYWYQYIFGDKDAFLAAWLKEKRPYWLAGELQLYEEKCFVQHGPDGEPAFLHRAGPFAKLEIDKSPVDPLIDVPHKHLVAQATAEFLAWWQKKLLPRPRVVERSGLDRLVEALPAFTRDNTTLDVLAEVYLDNCYHLPHSMHGEVVIDVGAHVGGFALACLERGCERVIAIEPDPVNYGYLLENLREYVGDRLVAWNVAAWTENTTLQFRTRDGARHSAGGSVVVDGGDCLVPALSLDEIVRISAGDAKQLGLKLDCEGAERYLLTECDLSRFAWIVGEWHYGSEDRGRGPSPAQCWERLRAEGFDVTWDEHPAVPGALGMFTARR